MRQPPLFVTATFNEYAEPSVHVANDGPVDAIDDAAKALTEARGSVAETVSSYKDELREMRNVRAERVRQARACKDEDDALTALDAILASLDAWTAASDAFLASVAGKR